MLRSELRGDPYVKRRENERLQEAIRRSASAIEMKHMNISAVLIGLGAQPIRGYKPLPNAQGALREAVTAYWEKHPDLEALMRLTTSQPPGAADFHWQLVDAPGFKLDETTTTPRSRNPVKTDFVQLEAENRRLGLEGERAVVELERQRLRRLGRVALADKVEHVSQTQGDGLGYDVLSFEESGKPKLIEVKTTRQLKEFPFLLTRNEVALSGEVPDQFHLYRLFNYGHKPSSYYALRGDLTSTCLLDAVTYQARPRAS